MSRPLSPAEIIEKARNRVAVAQTTGALEAALNRAHGAIHTLLDLRVIAIGVWREAIEGVDQQAEQTAKALSEAGGSQ
jgi:hypothetical protein